MQAIQQEIKHQCAAGFEQLTSLITNYVIDQLKITCVRDIKIRFFHNRVYIAKNE